MALESWMHCPPRQSSRTGRNERIYHFVTHSRSTPRRHLVDADAVKKHSSLVNLDKRL